MAVQLSVLMDRCLVANTAPGSSGVTGNKLSEGEADGEGMLQVDQEEGDICYRVLGRETSEAWKGDERIETSTAQASSFKTDDLCTAFYAAEYVAETVEESDFGSELHQGTEVFVFKASTALARCDSLALVPISIPSS